MTTLREHLELAIYEPLGVDPDRVPRDEGVQYVLDAIVAWLDTAEVRHVLYDAQCQVGGPPLRMMQLALIRLAEEGKTS